MSFYITQILHDPVARAVLQQLDYEDGTDAENMLIDLDNSLKEHTTTGGVNGAEPCSKDENPEELADIVTVWLDDQKHGRLCWPCWDPEDCPGDLCYDGQDHHLITDGVKDLVCALNRARQSFARKRYVAIAQATLITARRHEVSRVKPGLTYSDLCRCFRKLLDPADRASGGSIDALSGQLQTRLQQDKVVDLPDIFFPLKAYSDTAQHIAVVTRVLNYLKDRKVIPAIGDSDEERLHIAAETCAILCFREQWELPTNLDDEMLPDLLWRLAIRQA